MSDGVIYRMESMTSVEDEDQQYDDEEEEEEEEEEEADPAEDEGEMDDVSNTNILRHTNSSKQGGMVSADKEVTKRQKTVVMRMVKDMGKNILSGNISLINVSLSVELFEARSYLQKLSDVWVYPQYLDKAAAANEKGDYVEMMKNVIAFNVAGIHCAFANFSKPFNPILGETFQGKYRNHDALVSAEQISHHPPISAFSVRKPDKSWHFTGSSEPDPSFKVNSIKTFSYGQRTLTFGHDGNQVNLNYPVFYVNNVIMGELRGDVRGDVTIMDKKNKLMATIKYGPGKINDGKGGSLKVMDAVIGEIVQYDTEEAMPNYADLIRKPKVHNYNQKKRTKTPEASTGEQAKPKSFGSRMNSIFGRRGEKAEKTPRSNRNRTPRFGKTQQGAQNTVCKINGSWVSHLDFDDQRYWTLSDKAQEIVPISDDMKADCMLRVLSSDCRYREDIKYLKDGNIEESNKWKVKLEEFQRNDSRLRVQGGGVDV